MPAANQTKSVIFIQGIMPRCGTNFLSNLLQIHPDIDVHSQVWEDYLLAHSDILMDFRQQVAAHWDPDWKVEPATPDFLLESVGEGMTQFLAAGTSSRYCVTKTPSVRNLENFCRFFPDSPLLILVRDGRAILESGIRSFGWNREAAMHWLAREARVIRQFVDRNPEAGYRLIRYEDLWSDTAATMRSVLEFLELNPERYDFEEARQLPLRGSSELLEGDRPNLHWDPVKRSESFDPLGRFSHWSGFRHFRYQRIAGDAMKPLGYAGLEQAAPALNWRVRNAGLDLLWQIKKPLRPLYHQLKNPAGNSGAHQRD